MRRTPLTLLVLSILWMGCRTPLYTPPRAVRIAVMPFGAPGSITGQPFDIHGWWFGAHDVRQSRNVGGWTAESLARQLEQLDCVEVVPPYDLRRYLQQQGRTLRQTHPDLTDEQVEAILSAIPLSDFGRDLEVDKIVTGQIFASQVSHNRTIDTWASTVDLQVQVWDVESLWAAEQADSVQTPEYELRLSEREWFESWLAATDEVCQDIATCMRREYFADPGFFRGL
ncbi:hypothetical protein JXA47_14275 [Candidatus Sumerlaeota bacterium]|nr:hypothetical protein [Candidatus Sumerlaeota bacterium]